jgi:hypothetical protein
MDIGIDTLIYIIIGIIFVLAQAVRKRGIKKGNIPGAQPAEGEKKAGPMQDFWDFLENAEEQKPPVRTEQVPPVTSDNLSFLHVEPAKSGIFRDENDLIRDAMIEIGSDESARPPDVDWEAVPLDLRTAVIHSVILERKYA